MDTLLEKYRRFRLLPLLLGLLLLGNELVHLHFHEQLHRPADRLELSADRTADAPALSAEPRHAAEPAAGEFSCPCCSSAIDRLSPSAPPEPTFGPAAVAVLRRDLAPPTSQCFLRHRPRSPPRA